MCFSSPAWPTNMDRRQIIQAAIASVLAGSNAWGRNPRGSPLAGLPPTTTLRGVGQNMRQTVQALGNAAYSWCSRTRHYTNTAFRYARFVLPTFYQTGTGLSLAAPIVDTLLPFNYYFQIGVEYPFNSSYTGIPARIAVTFSGLETASYTQTGPGYVLSDLVDFGSVVPANTFFGLWTTIENQVGPSGTNSIPNQLGGGENILTNRYQGFVSSTTTSLIGNTTALTASSCTEYDSGVTNLGQAVYTPCMMLIQVPTNSTQKFIFGIGDSIMYGGGEGTCINPGASPTCGTSYEQGDQFGSALSNAGWEARWIYEYLGNEFVNLGRGGDMFAFASSTNWQYRLALLSLANPTCIFSENGFNDLGLYGNATTLLSYAQAAYALMLAHADVPIIQVPAGPDASSTDDYETTGNQTGRTAAFGGSASARGIWNDTYVRTNGSALGNVGFADYSTVLEYNYVEGNPSTETSLWNVNGQPYWLTADGGHPNSNGAATVAATGPACKRGGSSTGNPFS